MSAQKPRRTLRNRVRFTLSVSVSVTTVFLLVAFSMIIHLILRFELSASADYISTSLSNTMNSRLFLEQMHIAGLESFNPKSTEAQEWLETIKRTDHMLSKDAPPEAKNAGGSSSGVLIPENTPTDQLMGKTGMLLVITIELNDYNLYCSSDARENLMNPESESFFSRFVNFSPFAFWINQISNDVNVEKPLLNSSRQTIGYVRTQLDTKLLGVFMFLFVTAIAALGIASSLLANILGRLMTHGIIRPILQLDSKIRALALSDLDSFTNSGIILPKRPLREIASIARSTMLIFDRMKEVTDRLEKQNAELESQNDELLTSRERIQQTQTELIQSQNLASVGQLTAALTHEINTPVGAMRSNIQLMDMMLPLFEARLSESNCSDLKEMGVQLHEAIKVCMLASDRVTDIIRSLKNFSRLDQSEFQAADIHDNLQSVLVLTSNLWKRNITIREDFAPLQPILCYPGLLNQVFMNLVVNAIQSMPDGGTLTIRTSDQDTDVLVEIQDAGTGISSENLPRIFEWGFTTKNISSGTGMGLAIAKDIVTQHHGVLSVKSTEGIGSTFSVRLPKSQNLEKKQL